MNDPFLLTPMNDSEYSQHNNDERYRRLFGLVPHVPGYVEEAMRVLDLNRKRESGHSGRIFVARDLKCRRDILRSRMQRRPE